MPLRHLTAIIEKLQHSLKTGANNSSYASPGQWIVNGNDQRRQSVVKAVFNEYYLNHLRWIAARKPEKRTKGIGGDWTRDAVIYNMFVRLTCAFDHDQNGRLDLPVNSLGSRETGTFLKATTMLPYIKSLGANTVHLLPI